MGVRAACRHSAAPAGPTSGVGVRPWPREHGAWAILLVSFGVGWAVAWEFDLRILPLLVSCSFALALRTDVLDAVATRSVGRLWPWGISDGLVSLAGLSAAAIGRPVLLGMAVVGLLAISADAALRAARVRRGLAADIVSTGALALAGPAALYTVSGVLSAQALCVWVVLTVHFLEAVLRVRARLAQAKDVGGGHRAWALVLAYHLAAAALAGALALFGWVPPAMWLAFAPAVLFALRERGRSGPVVLARVGRSERNGSILFAVLLVTSYRLW